MRRKKIEKNKIIAAIFFISLAVFLLLSLISYHVEDPIGFSNEPRFIEVKNWFGILGSTIAAPIFEWTFGYGALIFPLLLIYLVSCSFRKIKWNIIFDTSIKLFLLGFFTGILLSLPEGLNRNGAFLNYYPGGFFTANIVRLLIYFTGKFGAIFIVILSLILYILWALKDISFIVRFLNVVTSALEKVKLLLYKGFKTFTKLFAAKEKVDRDEDEEKSFTEVTDEHDDIPELDSEINEAETVKPFEETASHDEEILEQVEEQEITASSVNPAQQKTGDSGNRVRNIFTEDIPEKEDIIEQFPPPEESNDSSHLEFIKEEPVSADSPSDDLDDILTLKRVKEKEENPPLNTDPVTMDFEVEDQIKEEEVELDDFIKIQLRKFKFPSTDFLDYDASAEQKVTREELEHNAQLLVETLSHFNVEANLVKVVEGPVVTQYQLKPAQGVKISKITALQDDLALALKAKGIRIIAPIPGKAAVGVEIPNRNRSTVYFKSVIRSQKFAEFKGELPIVLGKTINGEVFYDDLTQMPHLLIAGATGTGKSVGLNVIIASLLYRLPPSDIKFILIDPKRLEFALYEDLKNHYLAYCPDLDEYVITEPDNAVLMLQSLIQEMEKRYNLLKEMAVRSIAEYNKKLKSISRKELKENYKHEHKHLPYLVVVIDELADLMLSSSREVEEPIARLTQKARAAGIHLILATQRPSVNVITGIIKANFPVRIAYQVPQKIDSKVILDVLGADQLIGKGDMLFKSPAFPKPIRIQTALLTTPEVEKIVKHIKKQPHFPPYTLELIKKDEATGGGNFSQSDYIDELFHQAKEIVILHQTASASLLQRKLRIGYARAASIIDQLEEAGIVGPPMGSKPRDVLIDKNDYLKGDVL
ncbi:MAG: hypothetical protein Kow00108_09140 [Calditrichia bacterium]